MLYSVNSDPIFVIDIGNTNIVCAVFQNGKIQGRARFESNPDYTPEEFFALMQSYFSARFLNEIKDVGIGSVVPQVGIQIKKMLQNHTTASIYEINGLSDLGIKYKISTPSTVGADLVANAFASWQKYHREAIIIDLGTATTIQHVSADGEYIGVVIAPGLKTAAYHLYKSTALLPEIDLKTPNKLLGNDTISAMRSGIIWGHTFMIQSFVKAIKQENPHIFDWNVLITGGLGELIAPLIDSEVSLEKDLTLEGLYLALLRLKEMY